MRDEVTFDQLCTAIGEATENKSSVYCFMAAPGGSTFEFENTKYELDREHTALILGNDACDVVLEMNDVSDITSEFDEMTQDINYWFNFNGVGSGVSIHTDNLKCA